MRNFKVQSTIHFSRLVHGCNVFRIRLRSIYMGDRPELITSEYLSMNSLALHTTISIRTLRKSIKSGMPHYRIGGMIRVKRSECHEWL
jgi:hypothetical protein